MGTTNAIKIFLLGVIAALLLTVALQDGKSAVNTANAGDHAVAGGIIALTSQVGTNGKNTALILVDTATKNMAYYIMDDASLFNMVAARHYGYDLGIHELKFKRDGYPVKDEKLRNKSYKSAEEAYKFFSGTK